MRRALNLAVFLVFAACSVGLASALHEHFAEHGHSHDRCSICLHHVAASTALVGEQVQAVCLSDTWHIGPLAHAGRPAAAARQSPAHPRAPPPP